MLVRQLRGTASRPRRRRRNWATARSRRPSRSFSFDSRSSRSTAPVSASIAELLNRHALMLGSTCAALPDTRDARSAPTRIRSSPRDAHGHHRRFRHRRRAVIHRRIRHFHAGQLADHRLKLEDRRQRALRNLRLIRRVGSQKFAARNHRIHQHRAVMVVNAGPQKRGVPVRLSAPRARK